MGILKLLNDTTVEQLDDLTQKNKSRGLAHLQGPGNRRRGDRSVSGEGGRRNSDNAPSGRRNADLASPGGRRGTTDTTQAVNSSEVPLSANEFPPK